MDPREQHGIGIGIGIATAGQGPAVVVIRDLGTLQNFSSFFFFFFPCVAQEVRNFGTYHRVVRPTLARGNGPDSGPNNEVLIGHVDGIIDLERG